MEGKNDLLIAAGLNFITLEPPRKSTPTIRIPYLE